jgi:hypothetical protein
MTSITPYANRLKLQLQSQYGDFGLLNSQEIDTASRAAGHHWRRCFWSPTVTILTFLRQVLHGNCSCRQAVAMTLAPQISQASSDADKMAADPSAYSQARQKLPLPVLQELNRRTIQGVQMEASALRLWCGRRVQIVDGASVSMPDMPELQKAFPQPWNQKPGCGFPVARLVVVFCWASGCLLDWVADSLNVGELNLVRRLYARLTRGTVVLGDRYFGSYYDLFLLRERGLEGVFRLHQRRPIDLRCGQHLGERDHLLTWTKPKLCPRGVSAEAWSEVPQSLVVRHMRADVAIAGFRTQKLELVTTLLDHTIYTADKLAGLYRDRWLAELNIRSLKTTMKMEILKCQTREMVLKELLVYQLAYNLIRLLMWRAASSCAVDVRRMSFAGTQQRINAFLPYLAQCHSSAEYERLGLRLLRYITADMLPDRPNRIEPRAVKRRPKNYRRLTVPRAKARTMTYFIEG